MRTTAPTPVQAPEIDTATSTQAIPSTSGAALTEHAAAIRALGRRVVADVIEIGRRLTEAKRIAGHGNWLVWLEREFGWSDTAERFIQVAALSNQIPQLAEFNLPISGLYLLAAPSTPTAARDAIIERNKGEPVSVADIKRTIDHFKGPGKDGKARTTQPARPTADDFAAAKKVGERAAAQVASERAKARSRQPPSDPGPSPASEVERLTARVEELQNKNRLLEIKITGLESEIEELKTQLAASSPKPPAPAEADTDGIPAFLLRRAAP